MFLVVVALAALAALVALWPEIPRWSGDGTRALGHEPLSPLATRLPPVTPGARVLCQGDSNVRGKPAVAMPFCAELARLAGLRVELRGHGGDTTAAGAARWATASNAEHPPAIVILLYGSNDAAPRAWLGRRRPVPLAEFRAALAHLAAAHAARGADVLILAPPPAGSPAMERRLQPYRLAAREAAAEAHCAFLDPAPAFAPADAQPALRRDALHLNQRGHHALGQWLARQFAR